MVRRKLPSDHNDLLDAAYAPPHQDLLNHRRLGQTDLKGSINHATRTESISIFDYAHLRVPLPKNLAKSGIFTPLKNGEYPQSYFLMRRSSDGFVSATGMYKAAFPWSSHEDEQLERKYHKSLQSGKGEEIAGNVWIAPDEALKIAYDYKILPWIVALLDNTPIEIGSKEKSLVSIQSPPVFNMPKEIASLLPVPDLTSSTRSRSKRSVSPSKSSGTTATPRKIASPRKKSSRAASVRAEDKNDDEKAIPVPKSAKVVAEKLKENGDDTKAQSETKKDDAVHISIKEVVEKEGEVETTTTSVQVDVPASHPDLTIPKNPEQLVEAAKELVVEAQKAEGTIAKRSSAASKKRKASTSITKEEVEAANGSTPKATKKIKTGLEEKIVAERAQNRALIGVSAMLAIGAVIPYFL